MSDIIKSEGSSLTALLHGNNEGLTIPKPFERDIMLFETHIAGTSHIEGMEELEPFLNIGDRLDFFREPDNYYDERAIVIKTKNGTKLGYIPKKDNAIFSRLMDAGKLLFGEITGKEIEEGWIKIFIKVLLHE